ncbi:MAG TPA: HD domain-containing phosphohydrolase [Pirellulales bacterium]|jgi:HD-GYP domain-containing protein (c-di-GMP phosphodiesterase class II)|nr:HD domain-containing phosphohydrolase [Pirellulales bacterium]
MPSSAQPTVDPRGLIPVSVKTLQLQGELAFDLYLWPSKSQPARLYRERHIPLRELDLQRLLDQKIDTLYTKSSDAEDYCQHLRTRILDDDTIPAAERYGALIDATRTLLTAAFEKGEIEGILRLSSQYGQDLVKIVCNQQNVLNDLLAVMTHDYSTFTHVSNVCTCCIVLAEAAGLREGSTLAQIAQGALLHDVGKCFIPAKIINKTTKLTEADQEIIRSHPSRGFEELCRRTDLNWGQLMMVYQHHERLDGRGYPCGLVDKEIHDWAKICAIADVYDALTRDRPYRKGADVKDVLEYMDRESGRSFDEEFTQCWIAALKECQA